VREPALRAVLRAWGRHPAEYDGDRPRRLDLEALNKQLAKLPLLRKAPASAPAQAAATPQVHALATDARQAYLLQDLVRLAQWTATPRAVTPTGVLKKPEVAGALRALRLPAPPAGFHSAKHLPDLDTRWRLAEDIGLLDISGKDAIPGPALAALDDDSQTLELWTSLWELAAVDGLVLIYEGRAVGHRWVTPPLLWALWRAGAPMPAAAVDPSGQADHDHVGFVAWVLDQLVAVGGVERLPDGRYQLTPLGRHGHLAVLDHDPGRGAWR
jgi:hypothetical protein